MIIPIKCFECGKPTGHLWDTYVKKVQELRERTDSEDSEEKPKTAHRNLTKLTPEGQALNDLGMTRDCCRIIFLSNADVSMIISSR